MLQTLRRSSGGRASSRPATLAGCMRWRSLPTRLSFFRLKASRMASRWLISPCSGSGCASGWLCCVSAESPASSRRSVKFRCGRMRPSRAGSICCHRARRFSAPSSSSKAATLAGCMRLSSLRTRLFLPASSAWTIWSLWLRLAASLVWRASGSVDFMVIRVAQQTGRDKALRNSYWPSQPASCSRFLRSVVPLAVWLSQSV